MSKLEPDVPYGSNITDDEAALDLALERIIYKQDQLLKPLRR